MTTNKHTSAGFIITLLTLSLVALFSPLSTSLVPSIGSVRAQPIATEANFTISPFAITAVPSGSSVTYNVNLVNAPDITGYSVAVQFNTAPTIATQILRVGQSDPTKVVTLAGVFAPNSTLDCVSANGVQSTGSKCNGSDGPDVVSASQLLLAPASYQPPSNVTLFSFTLSVVGTGFQQLHILQPTLVNGFLENKNLPSTSSDGYFSNKLCGSTYCAPPVVQFTWSPLTPRAGQTVTFNASASHVVNAGASILSYDWTFVSSAGNSFTEYNQPKVFNVTFGVQGNYTATLLLVENDGIKWSGTQSLIVTFLSISLVIRDSSINILPSSGPPGTQFTLTYTVTNNSTQSENVTTSLSVAGTTIFSHSYGLVDKFGNVEASTKWDSSGRDPGGYLVAAEVVPVQGENNTASNFASTFVLVTYPQPGGASLSLVETGALGLVILVAAIYGVASVLPRVIRKRPSFDMEPV